MRDPHSLGPTLITGGTGFLGCHLARLLVARGAPPLLVSRSAAAEQLPSDLRGRVRLATADLCRAGDLEELLKREQPATLFHLAGARGRDAGAAVRCSELNVLATARLLDGAMRHGIARVVMTGSAEEYGPQPAPQKETNPLRPASVYGITKAAGTGLALAYAEQGCAVTVLRPFTVYGPGQPAEMFLAAALSAAITRQPFEMTEGRQQRDLVFVTDVAEALLAAAHSPAAVGRVINVGTGRSHPLCEVARLIWRLTGTQSPLLIGARPAAAHELYDTRADLALARELLGWAPRVDLETGLRMTLAALMSQIGMPVRDRHLT